ncbi:Beta_helix domain-containing protein (plasmid) [Rhodovastum atsumiense]|nr:right-handed parallel beta-helix repeat-containing protein [Rhodovastum atsumiense]CAH2605714.1 Beta_helix domain-containing protein [Rhodovastum atsumiense]
MGRHFLRVAAALALLAFLAVRPADAQARQWHVDQAGPAVGDGTAWATAWGSFHAIDWGKIAPGDTVYISGGSSGQTYKEPLTVGASGSAAGAITITKGIDPGHNGAVVIDGQGVQPLGVEIYGQNYVTVSQLEVRNTATAAFSVKSVTAGVVLEDNSAYSGDTGDGTSRGYDVRDSVGPNAVVVRRNSFSTPASTQAQTDGIWSSNNNGVVFENNRIVVSNSDTTGHSDGIQSFQDISITVRNNWFEQANNAPINNHGIWLQNERSGGVIEVYNNVVLAPNLIADAAVSHEQLSDWGHISVVQFWNNTILGGDRALQLNNAPLDDVRNNIIWTEHAGGRGIDLKGTAPAADQIDYNLLYAPNGYAGYIEGIHTFSWSQWQARGYDVHGLSANPQFINPTAKDFRPGLRSPILNAGERLPGISVGFGDIAVPHGARPNLGAYQEQPSGVTGSR